MTGGRSKADAVFEPAMLSVLLLYIALNGFAVDGSVFSMALGVAVSVAWALIAISRWRTWPT